MPRFTGKERDAESGLDYFGARYYASVVGRFSSPDWSATAEPVPYAKLSDPQSLNLYAYVGNNPLGRVDPDGHLGLNNGSPEQCSSNASGSACASTDAAQKASNSAQAQQQVSAAVNGKSVTYTYPDGSTVVLSGTHPYRDNNPGDLTGGHGSIGRDGPFAIYSSDTAGWDALQATLTGKYGNSTIADTMKAFNPPDNGKDPMTKGNDPVKYAATLAAAVGVPVSTRISSLSPGQLATVMVNIGRAEGYNSSANTAVYTAPPNQ